MPLFIHLAFTRDAPTSVAVERKNVGERRPADTGDWAHSRECVIIVGNRARLIREAGSWIDAECRGSCGAIPEVDVEDVDEAPDEQTGAD